MRISGEKSLNRRGESVELNYATKLSCLTRSNACRMSRKTAFLWHQRFTFSVMLMAAAVPFSEVVLGIREKRFIFCVLLRSLQDDFLSDCWEREEDWLADSWRRAVQSSQVLELQMIVSSLHARGSIAVSQLDWWYCIGRRLISLKGFRRFVADVFRYGTFPVFQQTDNRSHLVGVLWEILEFVSLNAVTWADIGRWC